jgi:hypothetical protein
MELGIILCHVALAFVVALIVSLVTVFSASCSKKDIETQSAVGFMDKRKAS